DQRNGRRLGIGAKNWSHFEGPHLAEIRGADDCGWRIPFQHGERVGRLGTGNDLKSLLCQRVAKPFRKIDVAVDQENSRKIRRRVHCCASAERVSFAAAPGATRASRLSTSTDSPSTSIVPATYAGRSAAGGSISPAASSHSPFTGIAPSSLPLPI